jgi:uncharacterized membrane protein YkvI
MTGFDFTLILTADTALQLLALVTVTETFDEEDGVKVVAEVVLPVLHLNVWEVELNFVSSVTEFDWHTSTEEGKFTTGFETMSIEVAAEPEQPMPSVIVTE